MTMTPRNEPIAAHLRRVEQSFALHLGPLSNLDAQSPVDLLLGRETPPASTQLL